jgi:hypothetical protein
VAHTCPNSTNKPALQTNTPPRPFKKKDSVTKWTEEDFQTAFQLFDRDGDGTITRDEVGTVLGSLGHQPTPEELDQIFREVSGGGSLSSDQPGFTAPKWSESLN